ncbi:hypothetical protein ACUOCP_56905, partial [Escherichia sp. R-CC3]
QEAMQEKKNVTLILLKGFHIKGTVGWVRVLLFLDLYKRYVDGSLSLIFAEFRHLVIEEHEPIQLSLF